MLKDFIQRVITVESPIEFHDTDGGRLPIVVSRSRNTNGFVSIRASFGKQTIEFNVDTDYEAAAREFAERLLEVASNPCSLPSNNEAMP